MDNPLDFLLSRPPTDSRDPQGWATVTGTNPLRIRLDGESQPLDITPMDLGGGPRYGPLSVNGTQVYGGDRVFVIWLSDSTMRSAASRILIVGPSNPIPVGSVLEYGGDTAPDGFVLANATAYSRTTYARLFGVYGTFWGAGDGVTTFNVPNYVDKVGVGAGGTFARGATGGEINHTLSLPEIPTHYHDQYVTAATGNNGGIRTDYVSDAASTPYPQGITTGAAGGGGAHNNMQPYLATRYIIKC